MGGGLGDVGHVVLVLGMGWNGFLCSGIGE